MSGDMRSVLSERAARRAAHLVSKVLLLCVALLSAAAAAQPESLSGSYPLEAAIQMAQSVSGVCVHLGCGDGALSAKLAEGKRLLVHGLEADEAKVAAARESLLARDLYGRVAVERWSSLTLPYADNLVNVVFAENPGLVPEAEIMRVLAPRGFALIRQAATWKKLVKPWPATYDEWTHGRHGADGNMVSRDLAVSAPSGLHWVAGPPQDPGGFRWYNDHVLISANGRNFYMGDDEIVARDAFNGSLLWRRPVKPSTFKERGADVPVFLQPLVKLGVRNTKVKPVAMGDQLYLAAEKKLMAWDARTGETMLEFGAVATPRDLLVAQGCLVLAEAGVVSAYDTTTQKKLWDFPMAADRIVAGEGKVFCAAKGSVAAVDLATGRPQWRTDRPPTSADVTCTYHQGVVVVESSSWRNDTAGCGLFVYSAREGRLLWWSDHWPDMTHWQEARSFFAGGLLWLQLEGDRLIGLDAPTGQQRKMWSSRGKHCSVPVATERFFIAAECDFTDLNTGARTQARMFKSACRLPFVPANGLLNSFPVQCECYPMLRGYMGLAGVVTSRPVSAPRLERGPAFGNLPAPSSPGASAVEWPAYRHDLFRSGGTAAALPELRPSCVWTAQVARLAPTPLREDWTVNPFVPGPVTAPVAAGGKVFVAVPDEHRIVALDAEEGATRWSFMAGGRIDTPPTIDQGLCLFGSHDGWIYCLEAASGRLVWRFRGAPYETRIMAYGQMESPWPAPGSVLVENGVAYCTAGRHPRCDDGVHVFALRVRTGQLVWEKVLNDVGLKDWYSPMLPTKKKVGLDFEPMDMLVKDGNSVAMSRWRFDPANGKGKLQIDSITYAVGSLAVPRGLWGYGIRQDKSVLPKRPAVFDARQVHRGTTNDVALLLAGGRVVKATTSGAIQDGSHRCQLEAPVVHDGLIAAYGRLYAATRDGRVLCVE
jgi:outer membrane protein assembly factor BamB